MPSRLQMASTAATCSASVGRATTAARAATSPCSAQVIASGHQSRLASPVTAGSSIDLRRTTPRNEASTASVHADVAAPAACRRGRGATGERDRRGGCTGPEFHGARRLVGDAFGQASTASSGARWVSGRPAA